MAEIIADRVAETSATTATDTYSLAGAMTGFQSFADGIGSGNTCRYMITDNIDWEVGLGTLATPTPNTLTRDSIEASSNSGAKVSWSAGTKNIYHVLSAGKINTLAASGANADITSMTGLSDDGIPIAKVSGALANISEDASPELGGEMDCGAHSIGFTQQAATGDLTTTIDWKLGNKFKFTFGAATPEVFTFTAPTNPCNLMLILVQDGTGSRLATWPGTVKWAGGVAPTLTTTASGIDIVSFYWDGTNYFGVASLAFAVPA